MIAQLAIPRNCPPEGIWLPAQQFYYQPPQIFKLFAKGVDKEPAVAKQGWNHPLLTPRPAPWPQYFEQNGPLHIEFCSGNGSWIIEKALANPLINWIALEKRLDRACQIWSKRQKLQLKNLFVVCAEGHLFAHTFIASASIDKIYINFPDPWPKEKHAKHRLFTSAFIGQLGRILKPGSELMLVTDDVEYCTHMRHCLSEEAGFSSTYPYPYYIDTLSGYGSSFFEELWRSKGKPIHYMCYQRKENSL